jgi:hypothetical protein
MQECVSTWEGCIAASGGQLEATKTYWYLIDFKWANGRWRYATLNDNPASVFMRSSSQSLIPIERLEVTEAQQTLGVRLAPDGNNSAEYVHLKQECNAWAARICTGMVPKQYAWQAFLSTIWAKIAYAILATTFSQAACESIMKQMVSATLSKAGVNHHFPRDLVYGDISRQGLGIPDLFVWQGAEAVSRFLRFMMSENSITSHLVKASYELLQLETGCHHPFLLPWSHWEKLVTKSYMKHIWRFLDTFSIKLKGPLQLGNGYREGNHLLMELCMQFMQVAEWGSCNICRIYMQAVWLSELTSGDGTVILATAIKGSSNPVVHRQWKWPNQGQPSAQDWIIWRKFLAMLGNVTRSGGISLYRPLGSWEAGYKHVWYFNPTLDRILHGPTNTVFCKKIGRPTRQASHCFIRSSESPQAFQKTTVCTTETRNSTVVLTGFAQITNTRN